VKNLNYVKLTNDMFKEEKKHYITIFLVCDYESGELEIKEPHKCAAMDWFEWNKLPEPLFLPIKNLLKQGFNPFN
jgi:8-oxo-dGTP diphosphatase